MNASPLIEVVGLSKTFGTRGSKVVEAVTPATFEIRAGETFGFVGESGAGKSTLGRMLLRLVEPSAGSVRVGGTEITSLSYRQMWLIRRHMQMVFQNPISALNPRKSVAGNLELPLLNYGFGDQRTRRRRVNDLLALVGLDLSLAEAFPHELSGGQAQRIGIARALAIEPNFIFLDEPVSALDVSVQAQILNLLKDLQVQLGLTYLFVAHNLNVVRFMCDRCAIMRSGEIVEMDCIDSVFEDPKHEYTRQLIDASLGLSDFQLLATPHRLG